MASRSSSLRSITGIAATLGLLIAVTACGTTGAEAPDPSPGSADCVEPTGTGFGSALLGPDGTTKGVTADSVEVTDEDIAAAKEAVAGKSVAISQHFPSDYTSQVVAGITTAMEELGATIITSDANADPQKQVSDIENLLAKQPALLVVFPVDAAASAPGIAAANDAGVPVVVVGSALEGADYDSLVTADNYEGGVIAAAQMIEALDGAGEIAILPYKYSLWHVDERVAGFKAGIACSDITVVEDSQTCQGPADCTTVFTNILTANPGITGGFGAYDGIALGMNAAAQSAGWDGYITTSDLAAASAKAIASGDQPLQGTAAQLTDSQGTTTGAIATLILAGKTPPKLVFCADVGVTQANVEEVYEQLFGEPLS